MFYSDFKFCVNASLNKLGCKCTCDCTSYKYRDKAKRPKIKVNRRVYKILYLESHFVAGVDWGSGRVWAPGYLDPAGCHYCVARLADHLVVAVVGHGRLKIKC